MAEEEPEHVMTEEERKAEEERRRQEFKAEVQFALAEVRKVIDKYDLEISNLREKRAIRKAEQSKWLERIKQNEEERRRRQAEENARLKEAAERKKKEREERRRAMRNPNAYKNVVQDERIRFARMTEEELAEEKEQTLAKRCPALDPDVMTSDDAMREIARELHAKIIKAFGSLFDLQQKEKRQKYDINELTSRISALQKAKLQASMHADGKIGKVSIPFGEKPTGRKLTAKEEKDSIMASGGVSARMGMFGGGDKKSAAAAAPMVAVDLLK